jgi:hypothetical protein
MTADNSCGVHSPGQERFAPSVVVAAPFIPALFEAAHECALGLGLRRFSLAGFSESRSSQRCEVHTSTHDNEAEDTHWNRLQRNANEQEKNAGNRAEDANDDVPG